MFAWSFLQTRDDSHSWSIPVSTHNWHTNGGMGTRASNFYLISTWLRGFLVIFPYLVCSFVCFLFKSLLGIARQWSREKFAILTLKPRSHVRILIYRTWAIVRRFIMDWFLFVLDRWEICVILPSLNLLSVFWSLGCNYLRPHHEFTDNAALVSGCHRRFRHGN